MPAESPQKEEKRDIFNFTDRVSRMLHSFKKMSFNIESTLSGVLFENSNFSIKYAVLSRIYINPHFEKNTSAVTHGSPEEGKAFFSSWRKKPQSVLLA